MMKYKVEIKFNDRIITDYFIVDYLGDLDNQIQKKYPKSKLISAMGGGYEVE